MNETEISEHLQEEEPKLVKENNSGFFKFFFIAFIIAISIRIFIAQPFIVNGASMEPTFQNGEYLIIDELTYRINREPQRGEVIVFRYPVDTKKFFIKRIVGLPNETVRIDNNEIFVDKASTTIKLVENFLDDYRLRDYEITLEDDEYFVMGDNRNVSSDSRVWGPVNENLIIGKAIFRFLPITSMGSLQNENGTQEQIINQ
jgi:signal peptidase I